jgi:hypothetical protein
MKPINAAGIVLNIISESKFGLLFVDLNKIKSLAPHSNLIKSCLKYIHTAINEPK